MSSRRHLGTGHVLVDLGPLSAPSTRRGRRRIKRAACALATFALVALQLRVMLSLPHDDEPASVPRSAGRSRLGADEAGDEPASSPPPPAAGSAPPLRVDLDARYPPEASYWSFWATVPAQPEALAPWMPALRDEMVRGAAAMPATVDGAEPGDAPDAADAPAATAAGGAQHPAVPRRLHQTWKDANPPHALFSPRWRKSMRRANPGWSYRLWTDAENRELIRTRYPWFLPTYDAYPTPIQRADVARYFLIYTYGGVYADLDIQCFKPFAPLLRGVSTLLSYKAGANFSRGASNSLFGSTAGHPFWRVVFDVLLNRSTTPLRGSHAVLYSTGPAVLREAVRRLLRLPDAATVTAPMLEQLQAALGLTLLDARWLHPVTAERRTEDRPGDLPPEAVCTHHFVSSWVAHDATMHAATDAARQQGDSRAAVHGVGQPVKTDNDW